MMFVADRLSVSARMVLGRVFAGVGLASVCVLATVVFGRDAQSSTPWSLLVGSAVVMIVSASVAMYQSSALAQQVQRERARGYTTDRWATSDLPEVAAGTGVVIREAGDGPVARGEHRALVAWARSSPSDSPRPVVRYLPEGYRGDDRLVFSLGWMLSAAATAYTATLVLVGAVMRLPGAAVGVALGVSAVVALAAFVLALRFSRGRKTGTTGGHPESAG